MLVIITSAVRKKEGIPNDGFTYARHFGSKRRTGMAFDSLVRKASRFERIVLTELKGESIS